MMFWSKNNRRDLVIGELLKLIRNLDARLKILEEAHNGTVDALEELGKSLWLEYSNTDRKWLEKHEAVHDN